MLFLAVLLATTALSFIARRRTGSWRDHARRGFAGAMIVAGLSHFAQAEPFVQHMPEWVPSRELIVHATGAVEVAFGAALLFVNSHRRTIGRLLAAYLLAVFPANVYVAIADVDITDQPGGIYAWLRLPLQALFVLWAMASTAAGTANDTWRAPRRSLVADLPASTRGSAA
jgi:uncharacterized membrane protein